MGLWELIVLAVGLSMDAFAVAVCRGLNMPRINYRQAGLIALFFGGFQALMPLLGWLLGAQFQAYITSYDHWIAFGLLVFIGAKMLFEALKGGDEQTGAKVLLTLRALFMLAVATSIDALAVGVTLALLPEVRVVPSALLIGAVTFALSFAGVLIGHRFGDWFERKAEIAGGIILVLIGLKILLEHLGVVAF